MVAIIQVNGFRLNLVIALFGHELIVNDIVESEVNLLIVLLESGMIVDAPDRILLQKK